MNPYLHGREVLILQVVDADDHAATGRFSSPVHPYFEGREGQLLGPAIRSLPTGHGLAVARTWTGPAPVKR